VKIGSNGAPDLPRIDKTPQPFDLNHFLCPTQSAGMNTDLKKRKTLADKIGFAFRGMLIPYQTEISIRIQTGVAAAVVGLGLYLGLSKTDWLWIVVACALVLLTEMLNTAIEKLVDLVSPGYNELAGKVKDIAAGAVFLAATLSVVIGAIVFIQYL
jgi:diacylglycerol kinase